MFSIWFLKYNILNLTDINTIQNMLLLIKLFLKTKTIQYYRIEFTFIHKLTIAYTVITNKKKNSIN